MEPSRLRTKRATFVLIGHAIIVALLLLSACDPDPVTTVGTITICATDPALQTCVPGDYQQLGKTQQLHFTAVDTRGKPLANTRLAIKISGANATTKTATTNASGQADFSYTGTNAGDDQISVVVSGDNITSTLSPGPAVIHWLKQTNYVHPIIYVHGTSEDAADFTVQMKPGFTDPNPFDPSKRTFTSLFEALRLKYDPKYLEALCFVDDRAYDHNGAPSGCRFPLDAADYSSACVPGNAARPCLSQGSVDQNAQQLANTVNALSAEAAAAGTGTAKVTLIAYSMGAAVTRSFLAGCPLSPAAQQSTCAAAVGKIDHIFFIDGDQQGSWLLTINKGYNAATLSGDASIPNPIAPFASVLPMLQKTLYDKVNAAISVNLSAQGILDQTPQSQSVLAHDQAPPPSNIDVYNFFGNVQMRLGVSIYGVPVSPGQPTLNLGDFVMLAQNNSATLAPLWGGGGLCDGCPAAIGPYRSNAQYHNWVLIDTHTLDLSFMADLLQGNLPSGSPIGDFVNSPVQHLNITQPPVQSPGSRWQIQDITGRASGGKTEMSTEIFYILTKADSLALP